MRRAGPHARRADQGRRRLSSLRHRSGRRRARLHPDGGVAARACGCAGCSATPATRITPRRKTSCATIARAGGRRCSPDLRARAAASGIALDEISVGATPTLRFSAGQPGVTELRPGNYVYFDRTQVALGAATLDDCALTVLATVVSKHPGPHHPRLRQQDADQRSGARHLAGRRLRRGAGRRADELDYAREIDETLTIERLSEEHATVRVDRRRRASSRATASASSPTTPASSRTWWTWSGWWTATRLLTRCRSRPGVESSSDG